MHNKESITILGAGSWGTTVSLVLFSNGHDVTLWSAFEYHTSDMLEKRENTDFLPGHSLPDTLKLTSDIISALKSNIIFMAVPVQHMRAVLEIVATSGVDLSSKIFVNVSKGIELSSLKTPYEILQQEIGVEKNNIVVLSGPTIAKEVVANVPTVAVAASLNEQNATRVQELFDGSTLRVYRNSDVVGVEQAGALKNVIAIACGIADGLGFGTNTKSALVTRGLKEIMEFAGLFETQKETFLGVAGLGDLCTTCFSPDSRNRTFGEKIAQGKSLEKILGDMKMVVEGVVTTKSVYLLAQKNNIDMPIVTQIYKVLYEEKSPLDAVSDLMARPLKVE